MEIDKKRVLDQLDVLSRGLERWQRKHSEFTQFIETEISATNSYLKAMHGFIDANLNKRGGKVVSSVKRIT